MTMRTAATMEMVHIQLMAAAKVNFRGRHSNQQTKCGNAINATVQRAWSESVFSATDMVMFADAQMRTRFSMNAPAKNMPNGLLMMYAQSTRFVTMGYRR
jgi:hypothetical protein